MDIKLYYMRASVAQATIIKTWEDEQDAAYKRRAANLWELCRYYGVTPGDFSSSAGDDASDYLPYWDTDDNELATPTKAISRWAAVTSSGEFNYIYPAYDTKEAAKDKAVTNVSDSIYAETPVILVNLDTGSRYSPNWSKLTWRGTGSIDKHSIEES